MTQNSSKPARTEMPEITSPNLFGLKALHQLTDDGINAVTLKSRSRLTTPNRISFLWPILLAKVSSQMLKWNLLKAYFPTGGLGRRSLACLALLLSTCLVFALSACEDKDETDLEILIGIEPDYVHLLDKVDEIKPGKTGIASVDALNEKWSVLDITPVFPDVSPDDEAANRYGLGGVLKIVVPANTDIETMLAEYQADPHVAYAEMNKPVEIK